MTSMTVPVRLTKNDIAVLADELNNCVSGSSELADIPHFKQDFNYVYFLSNNYICHFFTVKKDIAEEINSENPFSKPKTEKSEMITRF